ncbi:MAG: T9SS type A sorting domain-containing protein, partial [Phycisphaerae bacterium]
HHGTHHGEKDDDEHGNKHHDKKFNKNIEFDGVALCGFLDLIAEHFNNAGLNPIIVYQPPASGLCEDKLRTAGSLLNPEGEESERAEATEELMALLLNVASAKLSLTAVASTDSASVSQAIAYVDQLIDDGDPANDALAKEIAKKINKGKKVAAGVIPLDIADIAYTPGRIPGRFDLGQNYPNPFNPATTIRFALPVRTHVRLTVYDVAGRRVATLVDETRPAGAHRVVWDRMSRSGNPVASGVYFYRIEAGKFKMTKKMVLLK